MFHATALVEAAALAGARARRARFLHRREGERRAGMGVCFTDLSAASLRCLDQALRGFPPPLPAARRFIPAFETRVELADGRGFFWVALGGLLSGGRPGPAAVGGGLMTAIFAVRPRGR